MSILTSGTGRVLGLGYLLSYRRDRKEFLPFPRCNIRIEIWLIAHPHLPFCIAPQVPNFSLPGCSKTPTAESHSYLSCPILRDYFILSHNPNYNSVLILVWYLNESSIVWGSHWQPSDTTSWFWHLTSGTSNLLVYNWRFWFFSQLMNFIFQVLSCKGNVAFVVEKNWKTEKIVNLDSPTTITLVIFHEHVLS